MAVYRFVATISEILSRAGLTQAAFAAGADLSPYGIRDKIHRGQRTRGTTAWKLADVYATHAGVTPEAAFALLFVAAADPPALREDTPQFYRLKANAHVALDRAQLTQADIARQAHLSLSRVNALLRRGERTRASTAWTIAHVYGQAVDIADDQALQHLFEEASQ